MSSRPRTIGYAVKSTVIQDWYYNGLIWSDQGRKRVYATRAEARRVNPGSGAKVVRIVRRGKAAPPAPRTVYTIRKKVVAEFDTREAAERAAGNLPGGLRDFYIVARASRQ